MLTYSQLENNDVIVFEKVCKNPLEVIVTQFWKLKNDKKSGFDQNSVLQSSNTLWYLYFKKTYVYFTKIYQKNGNLLIRLLSNLLSLPKNV